MQNLTFDFISYIVVGLRLSHYFWIEDQFAYISAIFHCTLLLRVNFINGFKKIEKKKLDHSGKKKYRLINHKFTACNCHRSGSHYESTDIIEQDLYCKNHKVNLPLNTTLPLSEHNMTTMRIAKSHIGEKFSAEV